MHLSQLDREAAVCGGEQLLKNGFQIVHLDRNFRSKKEIVRFNNGFFRTMTENAPPLVTDAYYALEQLLPEKTGGGVELRVTAETGEYEEFVLMQTAGIVDEVLREKYKYRDVAVLTRSNKLASSVAEALTRKGVPVVSSESLLLSASPEVRFLLASLRYVEQPWNKVARTHLLAYLSRQYAEGSPLDDQLSAADSEPAFSDRLAKWGFCPDWERLRRLNLYERFRALADLFRLWRDDPYLMAFGEVVWAHHMNAEQQDEDFLEMWEEQQSHFSLSNPEGVNAVQVMTIHKAKGLAFPVVIYPIGKKKNGVEGKKGWVRLDPPVEAAGERLRVAWMNLNQSLKETSYSAVYQEEAEMTELDRLNLDYVAFTRAEDRLYLLARQEKNGSALERYFRENCGAAPETIPDDAAAIRYHFPSGESFATFEKTESAPTGTEPVFTFPALGPLPPLAYALPEEESGKEAALGTLVHQYLSRMFRRQDAEWLQTAVRHDPELSDEMQDFMERLLANIAVQPEAGCLFGDADTLVRTEAEMLSPDGKMSRPDRLLVKGNEVKVFDYKTGQPNKAHHTQLQDYVHCLRQIGYTVSEARLVYIDTETAALTLIPLSL